VTLALAAVLAATGLLTAAATAAPLAFELGKPLTLACQTHSTVVAPTAASTIGKLRLRLEAKDTNGSDRTGSWSVIDHDTAHTASLAARLKDGCATSCILHLGNAAAPELWAPKRAALGAVGVGEPLTVAVIDPLTLKLRASTFIDKEIAALEQGDCTLEP
jgi:hypothetical protein